MKPHLKEDCKNLQTLLFALTDKRRSLANDSPVAIKIDEEVEVCQAYIRSYRTLKRHEQPTGS
jgi:hypothetical protein